MDNTKQMELQETPNNENSQQPEQSAAPSPETNQENGQQMLTVLNDTANTPVFSDKVSFDHAQRVALMLSKSDLVPQSYKGNIANVMVALEMAKRIGASPLMVMQNLNIIQGKPSWSSQFIIASINSSGKFSPLRFEMSGEGETRACYAWAYDKSTNDKLIGPSVSMDMAKSEGWSTKAGSKWKTMPDLMIRYRAAAFFGRLYAPEIMMGMQTMEEVYDTSANEQHSAEQKKLASENMKQAYNNQSKTA